MFTVCICTQFLYAALHGNMMHTSLHSGIQNYVVLHCSYFLYWCSVDELQRLLKDKEAYNAFFNSLDQVKTQNNLRDELRRETLQLARENLEREQRISELRNQCTIIRTTELATAEDRLADLERQKDEIMRHNG
ncbi:vacuolar protein-sorting-associated protein 37 homolog 1-like [Lolium perenne]|uniref:vacuolar protein-sorting-associated protein 37 homolog 1-like n=1 Tax=Lolium perenne TaxID=4522 RepID=UPI003A9A1370